MRPAFLLLLSEGVVNSSKIIVANYCVSSRIFLEGTRRVWVPRKHLIVFLRFRFGKGLNETLIYWANKEKGNTVLEWCFHFHFHIFPVFRLLRSIFFPRYVLERKSEKTNITWPKNASMRKKGKVALERCSKKIFNILLRNSRQQGTFCRRFHFDKIWPPESWDYELSNAEKTVKIRYDLMG